MSITRIGTATGTTTCTVPAHQPGDLIVICAERSATSFATLGTGFTSLLTKAGTSVSMTIGYRWATATNDASGTWTNALALTCVVLRPSSGNVLGVGASATHAQTTNTINYPALTLSDGYSSNTWVLGFAVCSNVTNTIVTAPSGMTNEALETAAAAQCAYHDTNGGVTSWASTNATTTGTPGNSVSATVEINLMPGTPQPTQVVQHVGGGSMPPTSASGPGNAFKIPINATLSGNCLVIGFSYDNGLTVSSVSDNVNGTWSGPVSGSHANAGTGNEDSTVYVFPNSAAGATLITVTFSASSNGFQYAFTEFWGIDASPSAGATSVAFAAGPTAAAGSFTPTNNNATGGNLIWMYAAQSTTASTQVCTNIRAGQNMTLLDADIGWTSVSDTFYHASASYVQTAYVAINPTLTFIGSPDQFNACAIALKINAAAGTPRPSSGVYLVRICHFTTTSFPAKAANAIYTLQAPVYGNLRVLACDDPNVSTTTVIHDNEGGTWTVRGGAGIGAGIWDRVNTSANSDLCITIQGGGADNRLSWRIYDFINMATAPFDNAAAVNESAASPTYTSGYFPTPTTGNGVVLMNVGLGQGGIANVIAPTGAQWLLCTYTGETDFDVIEDADLSAYYIYSSNAAQTWKWTIPSTTSTSGGYAIYAAASASVHLQTLGWTTISTLELTKAVAATQVITTLSTLLTQKAIVKYAAYVTISGLILVKTVGKYTAVSTISALSVTRVATHLQALGWTTISTLGLMKAVGTTRTFTTASIFSVQKAIAKRVTVATLSNLTLVKAASKYINVATISALTLIKSLGKAVTFSTLSSILTIKSVGKKVSGVTVSLVSAVGQYISHGGTIYPQVVTIASVSTLKLVKSVGKFASISTSSTVIGIRSVGKFVVISANSIALVYCHIIDGVYAFYRKSSSSLGTRSGTRQKNK